MTFTQEEPEGAAGPPVTQNMNFAGGAVFPHLSGLTATHSSSALHATHRAAWALESSVTGALRQWFLWLVPPFSQDGDDSVVG